MKTEEVNAILGTQLTAEQAQRAYYAAKNDSHHWLKEANHDTLPDLIECGVDDYGMQRLSFQIAGNTVIESAQSRRS